MGQVGLLSYVWFVPIMVCTTWFGTELEKRIKPFYVVFLISIIGIVFEIIVFSDPLNSFYFDTVVDGSRLTDYNINMRSPAGYLMLALLGPVMVVMGLGAILAMTRSSGKLHKKFLLGFSGIVCFSIFGFMEGLTQPGALLLIVRIGYFSSFGLAHLGDTI